MPIEKLSRWALIVLSFTAANASPSAAFAGDSSVFGSPLEDLKLYVTAPLRWDENDWLYFGASLVAVGASHEFDGRVRSHFASGSSALNGGKDGNSLRDALPTVAIIGGSGMGALFYRDADGYRETWSLLEAGILSTVTGEVLEYAAGRERPDATTSTNQWRQRGDAFPSLHADAAFAVGTVFAESGGDEYRMIRRLIGYGVAAGTAYVRVRDNEHWLSDTVAGAAIGIATARFVLNRQAAGDRAMAVTIQPMKSGWMVSYSIRTR